MNATSRSPHRRSGSALLISLWALAILSFAVLGAVQVSSVRLDEDLARQREARALELAESGLALASHPNVRRGESILQKEFSPYESFHADLGSEAARVQINAILADSKKRPILERLFYLWGLRNAEIDLVIDSLADWVDVNDEKRINGAESADYTADGKTNYPANRPFESVEEMALVKNMNLLEKVKPDWRDFFTVWSDGKIDLNEASAEVISAACNISLGQAQSLVSKRNGPDALPNTPDDVRYTDLNQIRIALGMSQQNFQSVAEHVTLESSLRRITSTGKVGPYQKTISVLVRVSNQTIQYYEWLEQ